MNESISQVGISHGDVLSALHGACFDVPWEARAMADILAMPGSFAFISSVADDPQGFILCRLAADEAEIITIGVAPNARRGGQAARLLRDAIELATGQGAAKMFLEVAQDNTAARALYEGSGFKIVGRRKGYYDHASGKIDALVYSLEITGK